MYLETKSSGETTRDTFLSAEALQIAEPQRAALITVLGMMERGEIKKEQFDMKTWCGSAHCIGGWAESVGGAFPISFCDTSALNYLFYPDEHPKWASTGAIRCRDPRRGALALRSYLTTGDSCWDLAMSAELRPA